MTLAFSWSARLMAGRLELPQLERLLTSPSDLLGHYQEHDKGIKEREDAAIRCFSLIGIQRCCT